MGQSLFVDEFRVVSECDGATCYRNVGDRLIQSPEGDDWDDLVLHQDKISVTPLHYDLTHHQFAEQLKQWALQVEREAREAGETVARDLSGELGAEVIG
jgi:broad specificity polyphosphatase/5'/3'-nucleotidase SurE